MTAVKEPLPIMLFETQQAWADWLAEHHETHRGLRLQIAKKHSEFHSVTYAEALDTALCYGWIDSKKEGFNEDFFLQSFTPRNPRSIWSQINRTKAEALIEAGKMMPRGLAAIETAKLNGNWEQAYASQKTISVPEDFVEALNNNPRAKTFFESLTSVNRYAYLFRLHASKKPETRQKNITRFIAMLEEGQTFH